jgi:hypothetical protein
MDQLNAQSGNELTTQQKLDQAARLSTRKKFIITIGVALVLILVIWIWKTIEINKVKKIAAQDQQTLSETASRQIVQSNEEYLRLLAKPIVWSMRSEMMQGNLSQINLYINDLVKEKNFQRIAIANEKGIVISSTDKKDEGQPFSVLASETALSRDNTNVENIADSVLIMTSPIMGFNNRLGTLYINYTIQKPDFN